MTLHTPRQQFSVTVLRSSISAHPALPNSKGTLPPLSGALYMGWVGKFAITGQNLAISWKRYGIRPQYGTLVGSRW